MAIKTFKIGHISLLLSFLTRVAWYGVVRTNPCLFHVSTPM